MTITVEVIRELHRIVLQHLTMPVYPPTDGSYLFAEVLDFNIKYNAEQPFYIFANLADSAAFTTITHLEFSRACHRVAHALRPSCKGQEGQVVAIIAMADTVVYQATTAGLILAGLVPFPISPRNSPAAIVNLLQKTDCHRLITTEDTLGSLVDDITSVLSAADPTYILLAEKMPTLEQVYPRLGAENSADPFLPFPPPVHRPGLRDICLYQHSSGSTGFPKAVPFTQQTILLWALSPVVTEFCDEVLSVMAQPPFHCMGLAGQLLCPMFGMITAAVFPPVVTSKDSLPLVPSPDLILDHMMRTGTTSIFIIPVFIQLWSSSTKAVEYLASLRTVAFGGGALAKKIGDGLVAAGVRLRTAYGGTEFAGPIHIKPLIEDDEEEWEWMRFHEIAMPRWNSQGDGTYELQLLTTDSHQPSVENLPDIRGYATSDIFQKHPTKPYLWRIVGRVDDVIIHSSGEKTVPGPMEEIILGSSIVQGAVMFGREHSLAGVLVELNPSHQIDRNDAMKMVELRNLLWPVIEEANRNAPAFSRIFKEMILFAAPNKALPRTGKGTVMRKAALQVYDTEITALYNSVESGTKGVQPPQEWSADHIERWLLKQASDLQSGRVFDPAADLFEQGFDSLSVTFLRHRIISALRSASDRDDEQKIGQNTVYSYPTISTLSQFLAELFAHPEGSSKMKNKQVEMEEMIQRYSIGLDATTNIKVKEDQDIYAPAVVLLTGSTGNLGAELLVSLLNDPRVERVYALNRPSSTKTIAERHQDRFADKGFNDALLQSNKLVFVEGDASESNLGLSDTLYEQLRSSVSVIVHNAWRLNFNLSLAAFGAHIHGTRNLIDLARSGPYSSTMRFLFTSSVATAQNWDPKRGMFPEEVIDDVGIAVGAGYGESKYISERILEKSGLKATSFRIGQISGGLPNGCWSTMDWLPILVKSSVALGAFPNSRGVITWTPMNIVATTILDVAFSREQPPKALNIVHPQPVTWESMILAIKDAIMQERHLRDENFPVIPFREWFTLLEERAKRADVQDVRDIPAIKLLDFFRNIALADIGADDEVGGLVKFSTKKVQAISPTLRNAHPIQGADAEMWVTYWNSVAMFD